MTPAVVVRSFDRVREGVPVVEDLAEPSFHQIRGHDPRLHGDGARRDLAKLSAAGIQERLGLRLFNHRQDCRVGDETTLDDLRGTGG